MYQVSQAYKESMKQPLRNHSYVNISLGLINQDAQITAVLENTDDFIDFSDPEIIFKQNGIGSKYATYEQNYWKADGTYLFRPKNSLDYYKTDITSEELFSDSFEVLIRFGYGRLDVKGLTIQFGDIFPVDFSIITTDGVEYSINDNDSSLFETDHVFENTDTLQIVISKMSSPNARVRISYVKFGVGLEYDNDWVMETDATSVVSVINDELPQVDLSVKLNNRDQIFNVDNPDSEINFLETGQKIRIDYGYELNDGSVEWLTGHSLYVSEWSADDSTATIMAADKMSFMSDTFYKGKYYANGVTLYDLAVEVFTDAGLTSDEYYLDECLKKVVVKNPLPIVMHKEALQIIANAGRCILGYSRDGQIQIYSAFIPNYETASNGSCYFSEASTLDVNSKKDCYAIYGMDSWKANGESLFLPKTGIANVGYVSSQISNADGKFTTNPIITRTLEAKYKCFGIQIEFSGILPAKFIIRTYADNVLKETLTIAKDIRKDFYLSHQFDEFDKIEIEFLETSIPNNRISIAAFSLGAETDYKIEYDDLYSTPVGTQLEKVKDLSVSRYIYNTTTTGNENLVDETITIEEANQTAIYQFDNACYGYVASIVDALSGQSVSIISSGAYYVEVQFNGISIGSEIEVVVSGYKYNVSTSSVVKNIYNRGTNKKWENPLISDESHCKSVCEWLADYYYSDIEYELTYRGDPALDVGDTIFQENKYDSNLKTIIEESRIATGVGCVLSGSMKTRRKERVDRTKSKLG